MIRAIFYHESLPLLPPCILRLALPFHAFNWQVLFFAAAREQVGEAEITVELTVGEATSAIVDELVARYPQLEKILPRCALSVNGDYIRGETPLAAGDEVAVLPPMSGG